jgi:hypothetical protein
MNSAFTRMAMTAPPAAANASESRGRSSIHRSGNGSFTAKLAPPKS